MLLPANADQVTAAWFSSILQDVCVKPETFKMKANAQDGKGFLSMLVRVEFETEKSESEAGNKIVTEKHNLVVKMIPESTPFFAESRGCMLASKCDQIEIYTYQKVLPELVQEIPGLKKYICNFVYGGVQEEDKANEIEYSSACVLEDLKPQGYATKMYNETWSANEFAQGIDFLASFHVASKCLERRKNATIPEIYSNWFKNWMVMGKWEPYSIIQFATAGYADVYEFLAEYSKTDLIPSYKKLEAQNEKMIVTLLKAAQKYPCGTHSDLWPHNMLVNQDNSKPIKVIDWQLFGYTDPMTDVALFILTTLPIESLTPDGVSKALRSYYDRYTELCEEKHIVQDRSFEELQSFFNTYGLGFPLIWYLCGIQQVRSIPGADPKILRSLELLVEMGVLDFLSSVVQDGC